VFAHPQKDGTKGRPFIKTGVGRNGLETGHQTSLHNRQEGIETRKRVGDKITNETMGSLLAGWGMRLNKNTSPPEVGGKHRINGIYVRGQAGGSRKSWKKDDRKAGPALKYQGQTTIF